MEGARSPNAHAHSGDLCGRRRSAPPLLDEIDEPAARTRRRRLVLEWLLLLLGVILEKLADERRR